MPELKDHVSLAHISLELEQPFWATGRTRRKRRQRGGGDKRKDEECEVRRKKKERLESLLPRRLWIPFISPPFILSWFEWVSLSCNKKTRNRDSLL